jgi:hypothetical protein
LAIAILHAPPQSDAMVETQWVPSAPGDSGLGSDRPLESQRIRRLRCESALQPVYFNAQVDNLEIRHAICHPCHHRPA